MPDAGQVPRPPDAQCKSQAFAVPSAEAEVRALRAQISPHFIFNSLTAIASFVRTMLSGDSRYDRYAYGLDATALTASEKRGLSLFFGDDGEEPPVTRRRPRFDAQTGEDLY